MFNLKSLEKAEKYNLQIDLQKYGEALEWYKKVEEIVLGDESEECKENRRKLILLDELDKEIEQGEINWLKNNKDKLLFDIQFEDKEYAFVDVLKFYLGEYKEDNKVYEGWFYGDGEAQEFKNMIMNS